MKRKASWVLFILSSLALAAGEAELEKVAQSPAWHRLLHYRRSFPLGLLKSDVDGEGFFFSPEGKTQPLSELKASVEAFSKNIQVGQLKLHPQCAFPARFEFLRKKLDLKIPVVKCPEFEKTLEAANPESVSLIFSSAYPNNPASMFGHTFFRLNKKTPPGQKKQDMLDYGLSFAAAVSPDENPIAFIALGLTGGYRGQFSYLPYYVKLNEYNNAESRDLWEYDLNLSPEESKFLLAHVWELETNSYFDYFFFDENCSYQMLTILEASKPEWNLTGFAVSVIPGETVKRLVEIPGAVRAIKYRPSLRKKMISQVEELDQPRRETLKRLLDYKTSPQTIKDPFVLDAALASLFYDKNEKEGQLEEKAKELQASLLIQRSKIPKTAQQLISDESGRPDLGHYAQRVSASPGVFRVSGEQTFFQEIGIKSAYHDLLNKDLGYLPFSQIDFPQVYFRYSPQTRQLFLENLELLHITSLFPLSFIEKRPSWRLQINYANIKDSSCLNCKSLMIRGGLGFTLPIFQQRHVFYGLLLGRSELGSHFERGYRLGPEAQIAAILSPIDNLKSRLALSVLWDPFSRESDSFVFQSDWEMALSLSQSWEIRSGLSSWWNASRQKTQNNQEAKISVNYYF